jgi:hypothetical protein
MNCLCKINAFSYETLEQTGDSFQRVRISKCGTLLSDGKKKTKCDYYNKSTIKTGIIIEERKIVKFNPVRVYKGTYNEVCRKEIDMYIHLCNITKDVPIVKKGTYHANINYNLNNLNYSLFFEETETIEQLIIRLQSPPDKIPKNKPVANTLKKKKIPKKINKPAKPVKRLDLSEIAEDEGGAENCKSDCEDDEASDNEECNKDNTFDVDNYESNDDCDEDDGAFSD